MLLAWPVHTTKRNIYIIYACLYKTDCIQKSFFCIVVIEIAWQRFSKNVRVRVRSKRTNTTKKVLVLQNLCAFFVFLGHGGGGGVFVAASILWTILFVGNCSVETRQSESNQLGTKEKKPQKKETKKKHIK